MNKLNSRQRTILKMLLQAQTAISAGDLGESVGLSARIIRHNIPYINCWLKPYGAEIQSKTKSGLMLQAPVEARDRVSRAIDKDQSNLIFSQKDREYILLFQVLTGPDDFNEEKIRCDLNISRTTLNHDWDRVEAWLNQRDLFLTRRPRVGISVQGRENDFRHALISLVLEIGIESELMNLSLWGIKPKTSADENLPLSTFKILQEVSNWDLPTGWEMVSFIENELDSKFADGEHLALALYWVVMIHRISRNRIIQLSDERISYLSSRPEYSTVQVIILRLLERTNLRLPAPEVAQLTLEVMTARGEFRIHQNVEVGSPGQERTVEIARKLVARVSSYMGTDLDNPEVVMRLSDHLARVIIRMKFGLPFQNKLKDEIKQAYPLLWQATLKATNEVWDEAGPPLPVEEIAYITMYMALALQLNKNIQRGKRHPTAVVACPSGGVTVWMLVSRLRAELPEIEIKEVIPLRDINKLEPSEVDAIICTTQVSSRKIKTITVNPLLSEDDILRIKNAFGLTQN